MAASLSRMVAVAFHVSSCPWAHFPYSGPVMPIPAASFCSRCHVSFAPGVSECHAMVCGGLYFGSEIGFVRTRSLFATCGSSVPPKRCFMLVPFKKSRLHEPEARRHASRELPGAD